MPRNPTAAPNAEHDTTTDPKPFENVDVDETVEKFHREWGGTGANIKVERQDERNASRWYIVGNWPLGDFNLETIRDNGGGQYRARLFGGSRGTSGYIYFAIDPRIKPRTMEGQPTAPAPGVSGPIDSGQLAALIADAVKQAVSATVAVLQPSKANNLQETLALVKQVKEIFIPAAGAVTGDPVEAIQRAFQAGMDAGRATEGGDYGAVIQNVGVPLVQLAREYMARTMPPRRGPAAPAPAGAGDAAPKGGEAMGMMIDNAIRVAVGRVVEWSKAKADPIECAGNVLVQIPPDYLQEVYNKVHDPGFAALIMNQYPALRESEEWFIQFVAGLRSQLVITPPEDETAESSAEGAAE